VTLREEIARIRADWLPQADSFPGSEGLAIQTLLDALDSVAASLEALVSDEPMSDPDWRREIQRVLSEVK
jgi:hypothetical protein